MIENLMIQHVGGVFGIETLKSRSVAPIDRAVIGVGATWPEALEAQVKIEHSGIEPGQGRDVEAFCHATMAAVPEAIEAIGLLAAFGDETGIHD